MVKRLPTVGERFALNGGPAIWRCIAVCPNGNIIATTAECAFGEHASTFEPYEAEQIEIEPRDRGAGITS